jgi:hypothetical protein
MSIGLPHLDLGGLRRHTDDVPESRLPRIDLSKVELPKPDLAAAGRAVGGGVDALTRRLDELGQEVRSIRVVRGPEPRVGPAAGVALLGGLGAGMALMYFLDPRVGAARRRQLIGRLQGGLSEARRQITDRRQDTWDDMGDTTDDLASQAGTTADEAVGAGQGAYQETSTEIDPLAPGYAEPRV